MTKLSFCNTFIRQNGQFSFRFIISGDSNSKLHVLESNLYYNCKFGKIFNEICTRTLPEKIVPLTYMQIHLKLRLKNT